ncbi:iron-containing alcohol dehydrogenase family protein [Desulforamulus ruminis]|uniref:Iron-containing alcohol dehydrogenase n=1 Tax=Desulforamulus ruminis (strain ATCC 23193 / DSM 2154 / NCIMB 8452 / DL) TaxID=696281 RepID=F6DSP7_DESRL|nr:iron-containing alcohol dehydrogenase family protein [Desulforamulus ruminis]AEG58866.1 iron-containing alcohol dehydrogenase [Desulforamulus ruminis DSM 2154]
MQFNFRCPTRIFFGRDCIAQNGSEFTALGKKALIVTGGSSSKGNGSLKDVVAILNQENIEYQVFDGIEQNPSLTTVFRGGRKGREMAADFIIGIGGGSPLDAAKAVAILTVNDMGEQDFIARKWTCQPLPVVAVPTTAGTGSEVTPYAVFTVDWAESKMLIAGENLFPTLAFLDGKYMLDLPWEVTANTAVDALTHGIEGYINKKATVFTDLLALESISIIGKLLRQMNPDHISLEEREQLLYASMLAGMVVAQTSANIVHAMGYPFTYFKGLPHGLANGVILPAALEYLAQGSPGRVEQVIKTMGCQDITEVGDLLRKVLPVTDIHLTSKEEEKFVAKTMLVKNLDNCPLRPGEKEVMAILSKIALQKV